MSKGSMIRTLCMGWAILLGATLSSRAQLLSNPSFEGPAGIGLSPPGWIALDSSSSPDTEPLDCDHFQASEGNTYLTLVARGSESSQANSQENCQTALLSPLEVGICYTLSIDVAGRTDLGHFQWGQGFISYSEATRLQVYGSDSPADKGTILASVEVALSNQWNTHLFSLRPASSIRYLTLEVELISPETGLGHVLVDNIQLSDEIKESIVLTDSITSEDLPYELEASEGWNYTWSPAVGLSCTDCRNPQVTSTQSQTYACTLEPGEESCPVRELFILHIEEILPPQDFKIPNVFTPNGDGLNDVFEIHGLPAQSSLEVFDRSGKLVFSEDPYLNRWEGSDLEGSSLPEGTYWYLLRTRGKAGAQKGHVTIKRK